MKNKRNDRGNLSATKVVRCAVFLSFVRLLEVCCAFQMQQTSRIQERWDQTIPKNTYLQATIDTHNVDQEWNIPTIDNVERIFAISDLHTDNSDNLDWLRDLCMTHSRNSNIGPNDVIIIAGDISHELSKLEETLCVIKDHLDCQIFFVWGNHEAWIGGQEMDSLGIETSLQKIELVKMQCNELGVHTDCKLVGTSNDNPVFILPIESWYDATLSLEKCEDLCEKFDFWRWVDFMRCEWPDAETLQEVSSTISKNSKKRELGKTGKIPLGLTEILINENNKSIQEVKDVYSNWMERNFIDKNGENGENGNTHDPKIAPPGLITFSHFLPNQKTLPDWKDPSSDTFLREEWLDHPVPDISAKFAKVAGSILIDEQIRDIIPYDEIPESMSDTFQSVPHLHVFGHSHRPKDFVFDGIRYIHNPLGKPAEREMNMVSHDVGFQLIWDCTNQSSSEKDVIFNKLNSDGKSDHIISSLGTNDNTAGGEIPGTQVIRYWEEQGGGKKVLARKMKHRRRRKRLEVKRFVRDLELSKNGEISSKSKERNS